MDMYTLLYLNWITNKDLLWASLVAQRIKRLPTMRETWVQSLGQEPNHSTSLTSDAIRK